jgi:hypothetical protein
MSPDPESSAGLADQAPVNDYDLFAEAYAAGHPGPGAV